MIRLGGLVSQKAFGKFEMGKVISNPFANAFIKEGEGEDHEVSMANNSIDIIIKMATELKAKMGEDEKQIPAWIQDHIAKAENLISQASGNYHEYGDSNESVNEANKPGDKLTHKHNSKIEIELIEPTSKGWKVYQIEKGKKKIAYFDKQDISGNNSLFESVVNEDNTPFETLMLIRNLEQTNKLLAQDLKTSKRLPNDKKENIKKSIVVNQGLINYYKETYKNLKNNESVNEASPCWKGYKQVGMKDKGGRQVPNCVPNESVVKEISGRTPKIFVKTAAVEKKIKELMADRKKAVVPYNSETDPAKKEKLKQILIKLTNQIKGYEKNLIQLRDMEEQYLQQMHADAELDTTGL